MTKWFDTNYHYMVPELSDDQEFRLSSTRIIDHFLEAKALGIHTRPVILGPVTFLKLAKSTSEGFNAIALLPKLLPVYEQLLRELAVAGADWVQIDEPALVLDLIPNELAAFELAYKRLTSVSGPKILLATYFGALGANLDTAISCQWPACMSILPVHRSNFPKSYRNSLRKSPFSRRDRRSQYLAHGPRFDH